jgi:hypothetical protein
VARGRGHHHLLVLVILPALAPTDAGSGHNIWTTMGLAVLKLTALGAVMAFCRREIRAMAAAELNPSIVVLARARYLASGGARAVCYDEAEAATALAVVLRAHLKASGATVRKTTPV